MQIITSCLEGGYFKSSETELAGVEQERRGSERVCSIFVDSTKTYQTHMGFGAAFTEAAALTLQEGGEKLRGEVIEALFGKSGNAYTLGRTHIGSCDFGTGDWSYTADGDKTLFSFDLFRKDKLIAPLIKDCLKASGGLFLVAAPWSPPAWMKDSGDMKRGGKLRKEYYSLWAEYFSRYIDEMEKQGIRINLVTPQNEPEAVQPWESCVYTAAEEAALVKELHKVFLAHGQNVKIAIVDHNRDILVDRCTEELADEEVRAAVWGAAYHWYCCERSENLSLFHGFFPDKHLFLSESCIEYCLPESQGDKESAKWGHAERYGREIIKDFNNWSEGWIDWNMLLNEQGGPNHVGNFCEAPVMFDRKNKKPVYNPSFYYIGHFSRYIRPGAKRLFCMADTGDKLYAVAYANENGTTAVVVQNESAQRSVRLWIDGKQALLTLPARSIQTFVSEKHELEK